MVVTQIAVSLVLLVGALLFVRSFRNLMTFDPGLRQEGITVAFLGCDARAGASRGDEFRTQLLDEIRAVPGVRDAATTTNVPLLGGRWSHGLERRGGRTRARTFTWVSPRYFETMGMPLRRAATSRRATPGLAGVAVVNQAFVRELLAGGGSHRQDAAQGEEPDYPSTVYEIVGMVADSRYADIRGNTPPQVFAPVRPNSPARRALGWTASCARTGPRLRSSPPSSASSRSHPDEAAESRPEGRGPGQMVRDKLMAMLSGFFGLLAVLLATSACTE